MYREVVELAQRHGKARRVRVDVTAGTANQKLAASFAAAELDALVGLMPIAPAQLGPAQWVVARFHV